MASNRAKSRLSRTAALAAVSLIAVCLTGSAQSSGRSDAVFSVRGHITMLAADGNRAAVTTHVKPGCGRIVVWNAPGKKSTRVKPGILGCGGDGVTQLAIGAGSVVWIEQGGGNNLEMIVMAAKLGGTRKQIEFATNGDRAGADPTGAWVGHLLGGGSLLAYNSWTQICDKPADQECGENDPRLRVTNQKLIRIAAGRRSVVTRGSAAYPLAAVGGGWIAVETPGAVTVLAASGAQVATVPGTEPSAVALSKTTLAIERTSTLDLYDPATGAALKSLPLGPASSVRLVDVTSKLALQRGRHSLVLVRLSDGKRLSFPLRSGAAATLVGARLTEAGLFYAYNTRSTSLPGRIVFEPTGKLLARF